MKKQTVADMQILAKGRGEFLSKQFLGNSVEHRWRCFECGHEFNRAPKVMKESLRDRGVFCKLCGRKRLGAYHKKELSDVIRLIERRGGVLLSTEYKNSKTKLSIQCGDCGDVFKKSWDHLKRPQWCGNCANNRPTTLEDCRRVAKEKNGDCLAKEIVNGAIPVLWICADGHTWEASPYAVMKTNGTWCPHCVGTLGEEVTRCYFEQFFGQKFPKKKKREILGEHGRPLELDGYCSKLKLAFEHQGPAHYGERKGYFVDSEQTIKNDKIKSKRAKELGITLIIVDYIPGRQSIEGAREAIARSCIKAGFHPVSGWETTQVDLTFAKLSQQGRFLIEAKQLAIEMGGHCLSKVCLNSKSNLSWQCKHKHEPFPQRLERVRNGMWCPACRKR